MSSVKYDNNYKPNLDLLPDPQVSCNIEGASVPIPKVGINELEWPIRFLSKSGMSKTLKANISAYVSLGQGSKGINMSRLIRVAQPFLDSELSLYAMKSILKEYKEKVGAEESYIKFKFDYPIRQKALRSDLTGWQYYSCATEGRMDVDGNFNLYLTVEYTYSSACPCSNELSEHARKERGIPAIPHSQRSSAVVTVKIDIDNVLYIEDLVEHLNNALHTEVQVMVKRADEQAFAELNAAYPKFVEDATRLIYSELDKDKKILDFNVICNHFESLHKHNACAVIFKGIEGGLR
jgi:GTP cyclohydrolase IB